VFDYGPVKPAVPDPPVRKLKIEADGDPWKGLVRPKIRLAGRWLERAGFKPGNHVQVNTPMPQKHYTPPLSRFLVCALHHQAKQRGIPMTRLANEIAQAGLKDSPGWRMAEAQQEAMQIRESATEYRTK